MLGYLPIGQYLEEISMKEKGIVNRQSRRSEKARLTMNMFLEVSIFFGLRATYSPF